MSHLRAVLRDVDWLLVLLPARVYVWLFGPEEASRRARAELEKIEPNVTPQRDGQIAKAQRGKEQ